MTRAAGEDFPRDRLAPLLKHFADLNDDRESWRVAYPIGEVLFLVTCATIADCDDFEEIVAWGEHHLEFLRRSVSSTMACRRAAGPRARAPA